MKVVGYFEHFLYRISNSHAPKMKYSIEYGDALQKNCTQYGFSGNSPLSTMHYTLTIQTSHFSLKNSDYKNFPNSGHFLCLFPSQDLIPWIAMHTCLPLGPTPILRSAYLTLNPCSICCNCCHVIF